MTQKAEVKTRAQKVVADASISGDRKTLKADSFIPAAMAAIYMILFLYFRIIGGYIIVRINDKQEDKL